MDNLLKKIRKKPVPTLLAILFLIFFTLIIIHRIYAAILLKKTTQAQAIPVVNVIKAERAPSVESIILPGDVQAWHAATMYARTNGYVANWYADIGAHVKSGQLLALIESPEVNQQLRQAEADLKSSKDSYQLALRTAKRWQNMLKEDAVSKQDADDRQTAAKTADANVNAARANRDRLVALVSFERVIAPFEGIITARSTDIGFLINQGSGTLPPLFQIAQADPLRIYVKVPQNYATRIKPDMEVTLYFREHPRKVFPAKLLQVAGAIDPRTRTLLVEFIASNRNYEIFPGGYTEVQIKLPVPPEFVILPVNVLMFRAQGLQVAILGKDNKVKLQLITLNRDFGNKVEVSSGVKPGEFIVLNPPDSLLDQQQVRIATLKKGG
jgi:RND family efflux transporter MFP subunit